MYSYIDTHTIDTYWFFYIWNISISNYTMFYKAATCGGSMELNGGCLRRKIESAVSGSSYKRIQRLCWLLFLLVFTAVFFVLRKFPNCATVPGGTCQHEQTVLQTRAIRPFKGGGLTSDVWNPIADESQIRTDTLLGSDVEKAIDLMMQRKMIRIYSNHG